MRKEGSDLWLSWFRTRTSPIHTESMKLQPGDEIELHEKTTSRMAAVLFGSLLLVTLAGINFFRNTRLWSSEHVVLSIRGSTSLGDELIPKLVQSFLRDEMKAQNTGITIAGRDSRGHSRVYVWGTIPGRSGRQVVEIDPSESSSAFQCLAPGSGGRRCDIGMASRPISSKDWNANPILKNMGGHLTEHVVALDAVAVIVNPRNPVSELSITQLRAIYSGQITNWKEVGGKDAPIELYGRDSDSGTYEMFTKNVFGKESGMNSSKFSLPSARQMTDSKSIVDAVIGSENAIGYVSSPMVRAAKTVAISDGSRPALRPTSLSVATDEYPICRRLMLYDWDAPGSLRNAFVQYVIYKPGQAVVAQTSFVELTPRTFAVSPRHNAPDEYKEIGEKYSRIGLSFHFVRERIDPSADPDSQLDSFSRANVLRLRTFLSQHSRTGSDILLLGFTDQSQAGDPGSKMAKIEAEVVATSLRAIGVVVPSENIRDFGADVPVASNQTVEGRRKNRRVEVWIRNGSEFNSHRASSTRLRGSRRRDP